MQARRHRLLLQRQLLEVTKTATDILYYYSMDTLVCTFLGVWFYVDRDTSNKHYRLQTKRSSYQKQFTLLQQTQTFFVSISG